MSHDVAMLWFKYFGGLIFSNQFNFYFPLCREIREIKIELV